jgi:hypothetical protein
MWKRPLPPSALIAISIGLCAAGLFAGCEEKPISDFGETKGNSAALTSASDSAADEKKLAPLPPGAKTVALERAGDEPYDKTFDDLRFDIEVGQEFHREMLPAKIEELKNQRVRIRGFILPTPQKRGIKVFVLVRDNQECCFGPGAALYDCILVEMQQGKTAEFSIKPVTIEGIFDIREVRGPDGKHLAIYHLAAESVE